MQSQFEEDAFAEVTATSMAIVKAIGGLSSLAIDSGPYLSGVLEAGLHDLDEMDYQTSRASDALPSVTRSNCTTPTL